MNFLDAQKLIQDLGNAEPAPLALMMSGEAAPLEIFLRAAFAKFERQLELRTLEFGTLQHALRRPAGSESEVVLAGPWDFCPSLDWRRGLPDKPIVVSELELQITEFAGCLRKRNCQLFYLPAALPPVSLNHKDSKTIAAMITLEAHALGAQVLPEDWFSLATYLNNGAPIAGSKAGLFALEVAAAVLVPPPSPAKLLITDLDNVMWRGIVGEDGVEGITCADSSKGFVHHIYQTLLVRLANQGVLIAAVSRNDLELARAPFEAGLTLLKEQQLVALRANYGSKSGQIKKLLDGLNLAADQAVFVDDNPVEIEEVSGALCDIHALTFPTHERDFPAFIDALSRHFSRPDERQITKEDRRRTELYRTRLAGLENRPETGSDLSDFLTSLEMVLEVNLRRPEETDRAVQLINKTNQFNINGRKFSQDQVQAVIKSGGELITASLSDKHGSHGEIAVCLVDNTSNIVSLVLSCRVFQRGVEHAFIAYIAKRHGPTSLGLEFTETARNKPARDFLANTVGISQVDGKWQLNPPQVNSPDTHAIELRELSADA